ncbi:hypothetical protein XELAEV_18022622mg [Xenopus laevis]|uniref:Uncharacterized protein n=1 Tax=Xenopus laevis TaxID=8355 RepID=A0A974HNC5_XENLA|nr:hypothetical protein XELAEV_18022622mg [Xenopus laevis]
MESSGSKEKTIFTNLADPFPSLMYRSVMQLVVLALLTCCHLHHLLLCFVRVNTRLKLCYTSPDLVRILAIQF